MALADIQAALLTVTDNVGHYEASDKTDQYIVWSEDGQSGSVWADGGMQEQSIQGTIDYYTKMEFDPNAPKIQEALNGVCSWRLNSIQYEDNTGYIHYEWVFDTEGF